MLAWTIRIQWICSILCHSVFYYMGHIASKCTYGQIWGSEIQIVKYWHKNGHALCLPLLRLPSIVPLTMVLSRASWRLTWSYHASFLFWQLSGISIGSGIGGECILLLCNGGHDRRTLASPLVSYFLCAVDMNILRCKLNLNGFQHTPRTIKISISLCAPRLWTFLSTIITFYLIVNLLLRIS